MIEKSQIHESNNEVTKYRILVHLKEEHHSKYEQLTEENIENYLAVVYKGEILSPGLPVIKSEISDGRFSIGPFKEEEKARQVMNQIAPKKD